MDTNLCTICQSIFHGRRKLREEQEHHLSLEDLERAAEGKCYICSHVTRDLKISEDSYSYPSSQTFVWCLTPLPDERPTWFRLTIEVAVKEDDKSEGSAVGNDLSEGESSDADSNSHSVMDYLAWSFIIQPAEGTDLLLQQDSDADVFSPTEVRTNIGSWDPPSSIYDPRLAALALKWFEDCKGQHAHSPSIVFRPTRLLDLSSVKSCRMIKLNCPVEDDRMSSVVYATMSHCWGQAKAIKLLSSNIDSLKHEGVCLDSLPVRYQEAIHFALELGTTYLWIDSLCIIQDSSQDWLYEAALMNQIYENADICIALAGAAENNLCSFTQRSVDWIRPLQISAHWEDHKPEEYYITDEFSINEVTDSALERRGWVVQESLLSRRTVYLGKTQVWYQCSKSMACEAYPGGWPRRWNPTGTILDQPEASIHLAWESTVERYSRTQFTFVSDRVIAFSGITKHFRRQLKDEVAGLWRSQLPAQLLWQIPDGNITYRPRPLRAPTWSWLSVEGPLQFLHRPELAEEGSTKALCSLHDVHMNDSCPDGRTYILEGWIKLLGTLHSIKLCDDRRLTHPLSESGETIEFIETSTPVKEHFGKKYTSARWFSDEKGKDDLLSIVVEDGTRGVVDIADDEDFKYIHAFCLPVLEYCQESFPMTCGLVLRESTIRTGSYERIGVYETVGDEEKSQFPALGVENITIV